MAESRLNRVHVATARTEVAISWEGRQELLERVRHLEGGEDVRRRFEAVGTSQPVTFDAAGKRLLIAVLEDWLNELN